MNSLSLLIYLASVIPNIGGFLFFVGVVVTFISTMTGAIMSLHLETNKMDVVKNYIIGGLCMIFVALLVPSERTFYMIAASEMGETVVTSPEAQEVFGELKDTIMFQLEQLQDKGEIK